MGLSGWHLLRMCLIFAQRLTSALQAHCKTSARYLLQERNNNNMLSWAITFLIIAIIAAVLGFGGVAGTAAWIAKVLFVVFLVLALISFVMRRT